MTEIVIVEWTVRNNQEIYGHIIQDTKNREKIVFIEDYAPGKKSEFTILPKDGEKWECELLYDTIPDKVYSAWDTKEECFPQMYDEEEEENKAHPRVKKFVQKYHMYKNPAHVGALIVRLFPGGNITLREQEEAERERQKKVLEKKLAEEEWKLNYPGYEVLNHFYPDLDFQSFQALYNGCKNIASNDIFPAIKAGMENGLEGYQKGLRKLKTWPENFTIHQRCFEKGFYIKADGFCGIIPDAKNCFTAIYNWLTREGNTTTFLRQKDGGFICFSCSGKFYRNKEAVQSAMASDQRLLCEHCGRTGTPKSSAQKMKV